MQPSSAKPLSSKPLAEILRPQKLEDIQGQEHLLQPHGLLGRMLLAGRLASIILWGPPGCGKTTLARLLAKRMGYHYIALAAVTAGAAELKQAFQEAEQLSHGLSPCPTLLFIDEIHRLTRIQQDILLPATESGLVILVGATTENPSFTLSSALLSRCQLALLKPLTEDALESLLQKVEAQLGTPLPLTEAARSHLKHMAGGDGRYLCNMADILTNIAQSEPDSAIFDEKTLAQLLNKRAPLYDKSKEQHYDLISVLHKAVRGSDTDAALYWLARMIQGGEDPRFIARRLMRMAVEDIGLADIEAMHITAAAADQYERLGSPEGELALANALIYLCNAPKSNAAYNAWKKAQKLAEAYPHEPAPYFARNASTKLMKNLGYGHGYIYDHDTEHGCAGQNYFPETLARHSLYHPVERGLEREIAKRLHWWQQFREKNPQ
ncbi:MAG: replication-associated recombination protein A [Alphaproteobacteria bacterium]